MHMYQKPRYLQEDGLQLPAVLAAAAGDAPGEEDLVGWHAGICHALVPLQHPDHYVGQAVLGLEHTKDVMSDQGAPNEQNPRRGMREAGEQPCPESRCQTKPVERDQSTQTPPQQLRIPPGSGQGRAPPRFPRPCPSPPAQVAAAALVEGLLAVL